MRLAATFAACLIAASLTGAAQADTRRISDRAEFLSLVEGRTLNHVGVALTVTPDGRIGGRAWGREVTGTWSWNGGYFCREMSWGDEPVASNCQAVQLEGSQLRFTSDRGQGQSAALTLR